MELLALFQPGVSCKEKNIARFASEPGQIV